MRRVVHWVLAGMGSLLWAFSVAGEPKSPRPAAVSPPSTDEERAFEADAERYSRLSELTRVLTQAAALVREREFDAEVDLYLKKRALTRELSVQNAVASRAKSVTAEPPTPPSTAAPSW